MITHAKHTLHGVLVGVSSSMLGLIVGLVL